MVGQLYNRYIYNFYLIAKSLIGLLHLLFSLPEVKEEKLAFLSVNISQDPLEIIFGCQRQRGGTSDNPSVSEFYNNTQALRVVNSFCRGPVRGNCRGAATVTQNITEEACVPLPKRSKSKQKPTE